MSLPNLLPIDAQLVRKHVHDQHARRVCRLAVLGVQRLMLQYNLGPLACHLSVIHNHVVLADVDWNRQSDLRMHLDPLSLLTELGRVGCARFVCIGGADHLIAARN